MNILILLVIILYNLNCINSSNILGLFPHNGFSHFKVFYPILKGLNAKGHNITVVTYVPSKNKLENYHEILLHDEEDATHVFTFQHFVPSRSFQAMFSEFWELADEGEKACSIFYNSGAVEEILQTHSVNPFDLIIMENFNTDCYLGLPVLMNIPFIGLSSCALMPWHYDRVGLPDTPSFIPSEFVGFSERMTYSERFVNFLVTKGVALLYRLTTERNDNEIIKNKLNISVNVHDIAKQTKLILVNQHYSLSGSRPLSRNVIEIGGIHIEEDQKVLSSDIEEFLQNSKDGVIFISFGSMLQTATLNPEKVNEIIKVLQHLPQNVIWKWEKENIPTNDKKFKFIKWAPQTEILCHPKVKIFWAHGGLLGVSESAYCGKPLIISPVYGDQFLNGRAAENRGMGIILPHDEMNYDKMLTTFQEISKDKYRKNAEYVSEIFRKRQNSPLETSLWWIESLLRNKANDNLLYSASVELNGFVYYSLDVISALILSFILPIVLILYCCFCRKKITVQTKKSKTQ